MMQISIREVIFIGVVLVKCVFVILKSEVSYLGKKQEV